MQGSGGNTADEYENKLRISCARVSRPLGCRHNVLGLARELAAGRLVWFGWRTPGCSTGHRSARALGFSSSFADATESSHSAIRCAGGALQPSGDRTVQPTLRIACPSSVRKRGVTSAVPGNTRGPYDNAAC
jgi:hypothetical protein